MTSGHRAWLLLTIALQLKNVPFLIYTTHISCSYEERAIDWAVSAAMPCVSSTKIPIIRGPITVRFIFSVWYRPKIKVAGERFPVQVSYSLYKQRAKFRDCSLFYNSNCMHGKLCHYWIWMDEPVQIKRAKMNFSWKQWNWFWTFYLLRGWENLDKMYLFAFNVKQFCASARLGNCNVMRRVINNYLRLHSCLC